MLTPGAVGDTEWKIIGLGDFNGDGKISQQRAIRQAYPSLFSDTNR